MASMSRRQQETTSDGKPKLNCVLHPDRECPPDCKNANRGGGGHCSQLTTIGGGVLEVLARNVIQARTARRWSQTELANAAGLTQQRISMIEVAASDMTLRTVAQIATALKTTPSALLSG